jgi:gliding motility-associated-like protein
LIVNTLPVIDAVADQPTVNINEPVQLNVLTTENLTYNWTPADLVSNANIQNPTAVLTQSTWFYVTATSTFGQTQCRFTDSVFVELNELTCSRKNVFIPNAFTPNGDGANDLFIPRSSILKSMKLVIYNRLGNQVFESNDINNGWDGNYKGQAAPEDAYGYYFIGECSQGEKITINGNVTLLR